MVKRAHHSCRGPAFGLQADFVKSILLPFALCNNAMEDIFLDALSTSICCALLDASD